MSWRTVVVSSRSKLELKNGYLVIRSDTVKRVHLDEISVLVIENTGSAVTAALLEALWENKTVVIFCDHKRNPGAQLLPYYNSLVLHVFLGDEPLTEGIERYLMRVKK